MKKILVTGSAGFIFSNFMRKVIRENLPYEFVSVDAILETYNLHNAKLNTDHKFYIGDIADEQFMKNVFELERPNYIIHGAAQSFVDDSITSAGPFIHSNVVGTQVMVDMAVKYKVEKFLYVSTDEVYGHFTDNNSSWAEISATKPRNPYSASKLAGELIVYAANQTHGLPFFITRSCNNFGPIQPPRNLVPRIIMSLLHDKPIPIHGDGKNIREWVCVEDHCSAIMYILENSPMNEVYNIGSGFELSNLEMVKLISDMMNKETEISFIPDRKGHDFRYSVDFTKLKNLGWSPQYDFETYMPKTIQWYIENKNRYVL